MHNIWAKPLCLRLLSLYRLGRFGRKPSISPAAGAGANNNATQRSGPFPAIPPAPKRKSTGCSLDGNLLTPAQVRRLLRLWPGPDQQTAAAMTATGRQQRRADILDPAVRQGCDGQPAGLHRLGRHRCQPGDRCDERRVQQHAVVRQLGRPRRGLRFLPESNGNDMNDGTYFTRNVNSQASGNLFFVLGLADTGRRLQLAHRQWRFGLRQALQPDRNSGPVRSRARQLGHDDRRPRGCRLGHASPQDGNQLRLIAVGKHRRMTKGFRAPFSCPFRIPQCELIAQRPSAPIVRANCDLMEPRHERIFAEVAALCRARRLHGRPADIGADQCRDHRAHDRPAFHDHTGHDAQFPLADRLPARRTHADHRKARQAVDRHAEGRKDRSHRRAGGRISGPGAVSWASMSRRPTPRTAASTSPMPSRVRADRASPSPARR